jgi:hypothetical protein
VLDKTSSLVETYVLFNSRTSEGYQRLVAGIVHVTMKELKDYLLKGITADSNHEEEVQMVVNHLRETYQAYCKTQPQPNTL